MKHRESREPVAHGLDGKPKVEEQPPRWDELPDVLFAEEVRRVLRVSRTACYEELAHGRLSGIAYRWGRSYRVPKEALRRLVEGETES